VGGGWGQGLAAVGGGDSGGWRRGRPVLADPSPPAPTGEAEGSAGARKTTGSGWFHGERIGRREKERWMGKG
jgi:hypothetical protein